MLPQNLKEFWQILCISEIWTWEPEDLCLVECEYFLISLKEIDIPFGSLDTNTYTVF